MTTKHTLKTLFPFVLGFLLSACQVFNGVAAQTSARSVPLPLTGSMASAAGASALLLYRNWGSEDTLLAPISADTGQPVAGFAPIDVGTNFVSAFSADRGLLAYISSSTNACPVKCLHLLDLRTWKETIKPLMLSEDDSMWPIMAFNPSGTLLGVALNIQASPGSQILLVDLSQDKVIRQVKFSSNVQQLSFTPDGSLAVYGNLAPILGKANIMYAALFDGSSLQLIWQQDLDMVSYGDESGLNVADPTQGKFLDPAAVFSPDAARLYVIAADEPRLVTVDFGARSVNNAEIHPPQTWLERLLDSTASVAYAKMLNGASKTGILSQDGKYMYVVGQSYTPVKDQAGNWTAESKALGLQVVDLSNGVEVAKMESQAYSVGLALDGKSILLGGWDNPPVGSSHSWTDLVDPTTYKVTGRLESEILPSRLLDGSQVFLSSLYLDGGTTKLAVYDPGSTTPRSQLKQFNQDDPTWLPIP